MNQLSNKKYIPEVESSLRKRMVRVPEQIHLASGIKILNKRIKSFIFTTDVAIISNNNADAILAVYPFTPTLGITQSIISSAPRPVFAGVGGGMTSGVRSLNMALQAELLGAYGVVVNAPMPNEVIHDIAEVLDIPIVSTVISRYDDYVGKLRAGAQILNVSGGKNTIPLVQQIRQELGHTVPIIATGGNTAENIEATIKAGANAISYTPPSTSEIFHQVMADYRKKNNKLHENDK